MPLQQKMSVLWVTKSVAKIRRKNKLLKIYLYLCKTKLRNLQTIDILKKIYTTLIIGVMTMVMLLVSGCEKEPVQGSLSIAGMLDGLFSINKEGDQVHFSRGNLQYQASTDTWRFAEHQWDYVGNANNGNVSVGGQKCNNANISSTYGGWIDLFGWGTSGWSSGAVAYRPWSTSTSNPDYYPGRVYTNGLTGNYVNADWAWHNAINNGGGKPHQWRVLTSGEWKYLFDTRSTPSKIRYAKATVNDVEGVILLPDNWSASYYTLNSTNTLGAAFSTNTIDATSWANKLEAHGAVFLPSGGYRWGTYVFYMGYGAYWSSTPNGKYNAYHLDFDAYGLYATNRSYRSNGLSVRPVRDKF
jgi:hypothetical protein